MKPKLILLTTAALILLGASAAVYFRYAAPTRIAFVNYLDFMYDAIVEANANPFIRTEQVRLEADTFRHATRYDAMYVFAHGNVNFTDEQKAQIRDAIERGTAIIYRVAVADEATNLLDPDQVQYVNDCLSNGGRRNLQRMLNYTRRVFDRKAWWVDPITDPFILPDSYYYHLGDEEVFTDAASFKAFAHRTGRHREGGKNIVLLSSQFGATGDLNTINQLVNGLEALGHNVYPTVAQGADRIPFLEAVQPDLILLTPHGRFGDEKSIEWLESANIPLLCPIIVFGAEDEWMRDPQGLSGGMLTQSITMPEVDGGVVPFVVAAQVRNERGLYVFRGIQKRVQTFLKLTNKWFALQDKPNSEKKVAIFYYKEPGKNAMVAEGLELAPSILSVLRRLQAEGYDTGPLPETPEALADLIQARGPVFGTYAEGSIGAFLAEGEPELIPAAELQSMIERQFEPEMIAELQAAYGEAPGDFMTTLVEGVANLVVARVPFGNVVLLPVPPAGLGEDSVTITHGVSTPPPYPYVGAYLWAQQSFGADAICHFGTHGSLEFTPQKQVALSAMDWPDALLAGTPHFYLYVISNIGEAMIAKRRSYAVINTHLTAPLMQSGIYGPLQSLADLIGKFENTDHAMMREQYRESIHHLLIESGIDKDLGFAYGDNQRITDDQVNRLHHYLDSIEGEKVTQGLHVYGVPYTPEEIEETVRLMALDDVLYQRLQLDIELGLVTPEQAEDEGFLADVYATPVRDQVNAVLWQGADPLSLLDEPTRSLLASHPERDDPEYGRWQRAQNVLTSLQSIHRYQEALAESPERELAAIINSLNGGYIAPQPGGDPAFNPEAVPTGRNLYSISAEKTPSPEAYVVARKQMDNLLQKQLAKTGAFPRKVAFTLWGGEFVRQEGITLAQIFYLLGVEPVRNRRGTVHDVKLIPLEELGRPRIDVVVQTSGQFRDLAASRISLINQAVQLAAKAQEPELYANYVREGAQLAEAVMKESGLPPAEARQLSTVRVFGGLNGSYGAGIMGLVENGDRWESEDEVAERYLHTMGAMYGDGIWGDYKPGAFAAALQNTDLLVQPRSANNWGPLSLDHVYEFMGGISSAIRYTTGKDVDAWFSDLRNPRNPGIQSLDEAIWSEARSTLLNPKYIRGMQEEGASAAGVLAETFRNTYGWEVLKTSAVDPSLWDQLTSVYIDDRYDLGIESWFRKINAYALQEMTAVMLEVVRKGYWQPDETVVHRIANLHAQLVTDHEAGCSGFVCNNRALRDMLSAYLDDDLKASLAHAVDQVRESRASEEVTGVQLTKTDTAELQPKHTETEEPSGPSRFVGLIALLAALSLSGLVIRKRNGQTPAP